MMVGTVLDASLAQVGRTLREHAADADAFEIRLDALDADVDLAHLRALTEKPLVATFRRKADGGQTKVDEAVRLARVAQAHEAGFDLVDLEEDAAADVPPAHVVRSHHDFSGTPSTDDLVRRGRALGAQGAHAKIACKCAGLDDAIKILSAQRHLVHAGITSSLMGMGPAFPRPLAHLVGAAFVYGGARSNAPGQPSLRESVATLRHWGMPRPGADLYLVLGHPIHHSLSPRLHNAAFAAAGVDAAYGALDMAKGDGLRVLLQAAPALALRGLSVTAPLKGAAYDAATQHTPEARRARAANCLRVRDGLVEAHNTDGIGATKVLARLVPNRRARVLLLGTGGAARGLLAGVDGADLVVAGRTPADLRAIENEFSVGAVALDQAAQYLDRYDVLVNATTVHEPLPINGFRGALFDLQYGAEPTAWERHAQDARLPFAGGRELLLEQAVPAFEYWTGRPGPRDAMARALEVAA